MTRICPQCQRVCGPHQPDPCLGELRGVVGACCGHGNRDEAYIGWEGNGPTVRGFVVDEQWRIELAELEKKQREEWFIIPLQVSREGFAEDLSDEDAMELGRFYEQVIRDHIEQENYSELRAK